jgi:hypothetical protein
VREKKAHCHVVNYSIYVLHYIRQKVISDSLMESLFCLFMLMCTDRDQLRDNSHFHYNQISNTECFYQKWILFIE